MGELKIQYVTDVEGQKTAVVVNIEDWRKVMKVYEEAELARSIRAGFADVAAVKAGKKKAITLGDLFDEL